MNNHLDLPSIERLETALREYPGALVKVKHDKALAMPSASPSTASCPTPPAPPEDPAVRAQVEALQAQVDRVDTLLEAGKYPEGLAQALRLRPQVETAGHAPLLARLLFLLGVLQDYTGDSASAEQSLRQAALVGARGGDRDRVAAARRPSSSSPWWRPPRSSPRTSGLSPLPSST